MKTNIIVSEKSWNQSLIKELTKKLTHIIDSDKSKVKF